MLKPHDLLVALKLLQTQDNDTAPTYAELASALKLSASEVHSAVVRALDSGLLRKPFPTAKRTMPVPIKTSLAEFIVSGVKYVWPASRGSIVRGVPTAGSLSSIAQSLGIPEPIQPLVWPHPEGKVRGESLIPLHQRAAEISLQDPEMYDWLALIDIMRLKTGREASLAAAAIKKRLS